MDTDQPHVEAAFKTTISRQEHYYFAVELVASPPAASLDARQFREYLMMVIDQWLGAVGGGIAVDVLDYQCPRATVRVPFGDHKGVWQAMTVCPFKLLDGAAAHFQVLRGSAFSAGVAAGSRSDPA
ncbi:hypothetical protein H4R18_001604 [Coemansia javaensis]|uniref:Ribonucleases P/MRP subunit Pop8-like domain-containing protein n=1 Tax=Coemansia javaensis TaxID=2761396 RepID=A0A9W8HJ63_9FUNG|nr:hypothetical protein H4R18_001604 [Coemansia javaensis]